MHALNKDLENTVTTPLEEMRAQGATPGSSPLDYGMLLDCTGFSMKLAYILASGLLSRALGDPSITPLRFSLLEVIGCNPGSSQVQLGNALGLSRSAATLAVDFWQDRGCVERRPSPADRRSVGVFLTKEGEKQLEFIRAAVREGDDALVAGLEPEEAVELRRLLAKIHG